MSTELDYEKIRGIVDEIILERRAKEVLYLGVAIALYGVIQAVFWRLIIMIQGIFYSDWFLDYIQNQMVQILFVGVAVIIFGVLLIIINQNKKAN